MPLTPFFKELGFDIGAGPHIERIIQTLQPRSKTLKDMAKDALFYLQESIVYDQKAAKKFLKPAALEPLNILINELEKVADFTESALEDAFKAVMERTGLKLGKIAQPVRVALTGRTASPGIFEITEIIGKKQVLSRLQSAIKFISEKSTVQT